MGSHVRNLVCVFLAAALAACQHPSAPTEVVGAQASAAAVTAPAVVAVREAVEAIAPVTAPKPIAIDAGAVALIVRYEVTSPTYYTSHLLAPVWPGAQSGVTWGIGYDGGQQTRARIVADWGMHAQVQRLADTSGIIGPQARALLPALRDVLTPYALAQDVFVIATLPAYADMTARAFRQGWGELRPTAQGALIATVYNRGAAMAGERRREMRTLRDECVPQHDYACMGAQFRAMQRLWLGTSIEAGMSARYQATARLAETPSDT